MQTRTPLEASMKGSRSRRSRAGRSLRVAVVLVAATIVLAGAAAATAHDGGLGGMIDGLGRGMGGWSDGGRGYGRGGQIAITAINGNDLSLKTTDGWTRTITANSSTTITEAGQTIKVSDLKVGDTVRFSQTANADGTYTIDAIVVVTPTISGTVTEIGSGSFKMTARDGTSWTISTTGTTTYKLGFSTTASAGSAADLKVGSGVVVQGTSATSNTMTAVTVRIQVPRVGGTVTAKTADTITIQRADGTPTTLHVSNSTTYQVAGKTGATPADVTVGMQVIAEGAQRSDGSIDATTVVAGAWMRGGHGGMWQTTPNASPSGTSNG